MKCWGSQSAQLGRGLYASGLLGDGGAERSTAVPVTVKGIDDAVSLTSGQGGYCALLRSTRVECWGNNQYNELGDGKMGSLSGVGAAQQSSPVPVPVKGLLNAATVVSDWVGYCALLTNGKVRCWGNNSFGELGDGKPYDAAVNYGSDVPVGVVGLRGVVRLVGDLFGYCAVLGNGNVKCWGTNTNDALGDGAAYASQNSSDVPEAVKGVAGAMDLASNSNYDDCAVLRTGLVKCWGNNGFDELGDGTSTNAAVAMPVVQLSKAALTGAAKVGNGFNGGFYCAVLKDGGAACWGWNFTGELGAGPAGASTPNSETALRVVGLGL